METYTELKELAHNPYYQAQKEKALNSFSNDMIDVPIVHLINRINDLNFCFTLQSCYGHFIYNGQTDSHNIDPLPPESSIDKVEYRIAYIALCIENSVSGRGLLKELKEITAIDQENIQFCCAEWFWEKQINSFVLQVEPDRFKREDKAIFNYQEALKIEKIREKFYVQLYELLQRQQST